MPRDLEIQSDLPSRVILLGLAFLIVCAPLAVGSVYIVAYSAMEMVVFGLILLHIWTSGFSRLAAMPADPTLRFSKAAASSSPAGGSSYLGSTFRLMFPLFVFLAVGLFQLVPLPFGFLKVLSPGTADLYERLGFSSGFYPLTLSVYNTTISLLQWSAYAGVFALVATFSPESGRLGNERWIPVLFITIFVIAFFEAVYGLFAALNRSPYLLWFERPFNVGIAAGTWMNPDHFAGFINMGVLCSIGLFTAFSGAYREKGHGAKESFLRLISSGKALFFWILLLGLPIMLLAAIFSLSRMGHTGLLAGLAFVVLIYSLKKSNILALVLVAVVSVALFWGIWKGMDPIIAKWGQLDEARLARVSIWEGVGKLSRTFPAFGTGLGTFELAYGPYESETADSSVTSHAHNDYLEVLSEAGVVGFLPWVLFYLFFLYTSIRLWFKRRDVFVKGIGAGGIAATLALLVHSIADFNLQIPSNALLMFIIMGLTWRTLHTSFRPV